MQMLLLIRYINYIRLYQKKLKFNFNCKWNHPLKTMPSCIRSIPICNGILLKKIII